MWKLGLAAGQLHLAEGPSSPSLGSFWNILSPLTVARLFPFLLLHLENTSPASSVCGFGQMERERGHQ